MARKYNYSFCTLLNIVARIHCLTPFGVLGSLNKDQHSMRIFCFTGSGTVIEPRTSRTKGSTVSSGWRHGVSSFSSFSGSGSTRAGFSGVSFLSCFLLFCCSSSRCVIFLRAASRDCLKSWGSSTFELGSFVFSLDSSARAISSSSFMKLVDAAFLISCDKFENLKK